MYPYLSIRLVALSLSLALCACVPPKLTPQERAALDARIAENKARGAQEKADFDADVIVRTALDGNAPPRVHDPGYPAGACLSPEPGADISAIKAPIPISEWGVWGGIICDNTPAGQRVLAWREWYCKGIEPDPDLLRKCVIGSWHNGYVKASYYGGVVTQRVTFTLTATSGIEFGPSTWQPGGP